MRGRGGESAFVPSVWRECITPFKDRRLFHVTDGSPNSHVEVVIDLGVSRVLGIFAVSELAKWSPCF